MSEGMHRFSRETRRALQVKSAAEFVSGRVKLKSDEFEGSREQRMTCWAAQALKNSYSDGA